MSEDGLRVVVGCDERVRRKAEIEQKCSQVTVADQLLARKMDATIERIMEDERGRGRRGRSSR